MSTDAIVLLKQDHKEIRKTFSDFERTGDKAFVAKGKLVDKMIELLTVHTYIENEVMYPRVRGLLPDLEDDILESYEEHHVADVLILELSAMKPRDERFTAKTTVLIESVRHHVKEEESELFPDVRKEIKRKELADLGSALEKAKKTAPTRPHPRAPDTPPGSLVAGPTAAAVDSASGAVGKAKAKVKKAVGGKK